MEPGDVKFLVVHCSATKASFDIGAEEIDKWHRENGWKCIGYHAVIRRCGAIELGRAFHEPGAHAASFNHRSIGVCLVGGVDESLDPECNFTDAQMSSLQVLLSTLIRIFPGASILGHRDLPNVKKDCPCFDVQEWWSGVNG